MDLTDREVEVVRLIASGASNADIATDLCITEGTASNHVGSVIQKLHAHNRAHVVVIALWFGCIRLADLPECVTYVPPMARED